MFGSVLAQAAIAADWQREAGVSVGGYYSDNVCLANRDKESKWVTTARPDLTLRGQGARGNLSLRAAAEYNSLGNSSTRCFGGQPGLTNREAVVPSLRFVGDYEALRNWLTLEADAFAGRNAIDPFAPGGRDNVSGRENTNITYSYSVGAVIQRRLLRNTDLRLRYRYNEQFNAVDVFGDSAEDRVEFDLGTDPAASRLSAGVRARYSEVRYEGTEISPPFDNELASAEVWTALQLTRSWQVNGLVGEEWNEFTSALDDIDGSYWDVGIRWAPNDRIEVGVGTGERFFGSTPRLNLSYRHKRSELSATYTRTLTFPRNLRADDDGTFDPDDPFEPGPGELPGDPLPGGRPTFIGNTPILDERFTLRYRFVARRTTIVLSGSDSQQERTEDGGEARFSSTDLTLSRNLSRQLTANLRLGWYERDGEGGNIGQFGEDTRGWRARLGFSREVGVDTTFSLSYRFVSQESDFALNDYDENRITFTVRHGF
ncbi:TIGR03016 family PEP-CTERM system-associated outer membrane protein [Kineobactrum salinum]|uniref:TIGR03016 family PEP-CTERM system-associated outer membrane protein n=1 Tax=Kineobactrum salinum TaxID=2708301 RepID=A0A6C0U6M6_9GAMM|nr:TIGR03016 family PEP-CTERM system-associated outer membrane protein [Kineobactrum salinum]